MRAVKRNRRSLAIGARKAALLRRKRERLRYVCCMLCEKSLAKVKSDPKLWLGLASLVAVDSLFVGSVIAISAYHVGVNATFHGHERDRNLAARRL